jgi:hypothetical protein
MLVSVLLVRIALPLRWWWYCVVLVVLVLLLFAAAVGGSGTLCPSVFNARLD